MSLEPIAWVAALALSSSFVVVEGARRADLDEQTPITGKQLYKMIGTSTVKLQIVDVRPDPTENYEDTHVPGAIPFPGCDMAAVPEAVNTASEQTPEQTIEWVMHGSEAAAAMREREARPHAI